MQQNKPDLKFKVSISSTQKAENDGSQGKKKYCSGNKCNIKAGVIIVICSQSEDLMIKEIDSSNRSLEKKNQNNKPCFKQYIKQPEI